jgi:hemoglobin
MKDIENREDITRLLEDFYRLALVDDLIGHHFVELDLENHLPVIIDFWDKILFGRPVYFGNPLAVHKVLSDKNPITLEHFQRWVNVFEATVDSLFEGEMAANAKLRAKMIAHSLNERLTSDAPTNFVDIKPL